jgi:hypothetical protein
VSSWAYVPYVYIYILLPTVHPMIGCAVYHVISICNNTIYPMIKAYERHETQAFCGPTLCQSLPSQGGGG